LHDANKIISYISVVFLCVGANGEDDPR